MFSGGADDRGDRAVAFGRRADVDDLDAIGLRGDELEVLLDLRRRWRAGRPCPCGSRSALRRRTCAASVARAERDGQADGERAPAARRSSPRHGAAGERSGQRSRPGATPGRPRTRRRADAGRASTARCRAARPARGRGRAALRAGPRPRPRSMYSATTDAMSRGANAWRSSSASMGMRTGSSDITLMHQNARNARMHTTRTIRILAFRALLRSCISCVVCRRHRRLDAAADREVADDGHAARLERPRPGRRGSGWSTCS